MLLQMQHIMHKDWFSTETDVNKKQKLKSIVHPKNTNSVINYSPSCCSKPVRPSFVFGTQIKIFLMKSESFLTLHRQQGSNHVQGPDRYQNHRQNSPCDISGSTVILWSYSNTFCCAKKKKKKRLYSTILLLHVTVAPFWKVSRRMRFLHQQHHAHALLICADQSTRMLRGTCQNGSRVTQRRRIVFS